MLKIAIYGKGGIGKSTTVSNLSASLAKKGYKVMQVGCDPKADSTVLLHNNTESTTVLALTQKFGDNFKVDDFVTLGFEKTICIEAGGPTPGLGCAGRGIVAALEKIKEKGVYEKYKPDIVFYDVLGDVVCGGFTMPMRSGYADKIIIVTSGENMSLHAAANIGLAIENFGERGYAGLGGIILNRRNVKNEEEKVEELASDINTSVIGTLSRSETVLRAEELGKTVIEAFPDSEMAKEYERLSQVIIKMYGEKENA